MPTSRLAQFEVVLLFLALGAIDLRADQTLYRYEGDVLPYDASAGWLVYDPCTSPCSESLDGGHFILSWPIASNTANYNLWIAQPPEPAPPTLWVEWRFKSNHPVGPSFYTCDAGIVPKYQAINAFTLMYGDRAFSADGGSTIALPLNEFHTYRFESPDGTTYSTAANGKKFMTGIGGIPNGFHYLQLHGYGGCGGDQIPNMVNEWDFVRYGTIGSGEQVDSTTPLSGALGPSAYTSFTSFLVTFDQPNYVYVDDISVSVTGGIAPVVTATRRTDTHDEHTVEIVLDRALPPDELTTFTLTDGTSTTNIHYDFRAVPAAIPTAGTYSLLTLVVALTLAAGLILRNRADVTAA